MTAPAPSLFNSSWPRAKPVSLNLQAFLSDERIFCASLTRLRQALWHKSGWGLVPERVRVRAPLSFGRVAVSATLSYFWDGDPPFDPITSSNFQHFFEARQIPGAIGRDERDVFQTHAADFRIIKPRLDGHDVAGAEFAGGICAHARRFVDFQTESVARAVKESFHAPVVAAGFVTLLLKKFLHGAMGIAGWDVRADFSEREVLSAQHGVVKLANRFTGASAHDGAGDVAEVTGFLRARKNINDERLVRSQGPVAAFVRVARLPSAGNNGVGGQPARLKNRAINHRAQFFRSQRQVVIKEFAVAADFGRAQDLHRLGHADLGHYQRGGNFPDFGGGFDFAFREKITRTGFDGDAEFFQARRQTERKIIGTVKARISFFLQNLPDDVGETGSHDSLGAEFLLILAE